VLFTLLNRVVFADVVGYKATAGSDAGADQSASGAAELGAYDGAADGRAANNLGLSVVVTVMTIGLGDCVLVRLLRNGRKRHSQDGGG
jgi:hypothetical protein